MFIKKKFQPATKYTAEETKEALMQRPSLARLIIVASLALLLALSGGVKTTAAKGKHKVKVKTEWTVITQAPGVEYALFAGKDVFRYQNRYYCYDGRWHQGNHYAGPWMPIPAPPPVIYQVDSVYFKKVPPGWCKGRKTGWRGAPLPPGQLKKLH